MDSDDDHSDQDLLAGEEGKGKKRLKVSFREEEPPRKKPDSGGGGLLSPQDIEHLKELADHMREREVEAPKQQAAKLSMMEDFGKQIMGFFYRDKKSVKDRVLYIVGDIASERYKIENSTFMSDKHQMCSEEVFYFRVCYPNKITRHQIEDLARVKNVVDVSLRKGLEPGEICVSVHVSDDPACVSHYMRQQVQADTQPLTPAFSVTKCNHNTQTILTAVGRHVQLDISPANSVPIPVEAKLTRDGRALHCSYIPLKDRVTLPRMRSLFALTILHSISFGALEADTRLVMFFEMFSSFISS